LTKIVKLLICGFAFANRKALPETANKFIIYELCLKTFIRLTNPPLLLFAIAGVTGLFDFNSTTVFKRTQLHIIVNICDVLTVISDEYE